MSDDFSRRKVEQSWEPGTLDATRRNIGPIDKEEAARMTQILGGEIKMEKSAPVDYSAFPPKERSYIHRSSGKTAGDVAGLASSSQAEKTVPDLNKNSKYGYVPPAKKMEEGGLPEIPSKERALMDKTMMSDAYKIKANYGIFNFVRHLKKNGTELVRPAFVQYTLKSHLDHYQLFLTTVKSIIQISPETYKSKIVNDPDPKFKFLRTVGNWTMKDLKILVSDLQQHPDNVTVAMMIKIVKLFYTDLLKIYYIGESKVSLFFKEIYSDLSKYQKADKEKILMLSKQGLTQWMYIYNQIIRGMYPLLMRMCSRRFDVFPDFFTSETANIFSFLGISKFDLILPERKSEKKSETAPKEEKKEKQQEENLRGKKDEVVDAGIKLLDRLFPDAGFTNLESFPDMYPYFQPIYEFRDGYNLLNAQNPLQITVTLLRIVEDIFQGCRNIVFTDEVIADPKNKDRLTVVLNEWSVYREELFEKHYANQLQDFVNQEYSQGDFKNSLFGKKIITTLLWQTKYYFLPNFNFEQLLLEKPVNDTKYAPLYLRTDFLRKSFAVLCANIDRAKGTKGKVLGIDNPWEKYEFDIPNAISRRMDVLLGAKKSNSAATNANLIKYAYLTVSVLDWWINNLQSPAYSSDSSKIYRISEKDGGPAFSVPVRNDQNKLFASSVRAAVSAKNTASVATT